MKTTLLDQIRKRRKSLELKIQDMPLLCGLTRQQYGKIEAGGNPRLTSLDQIAEGLQAALLLVPKSKLDIIQKILASDTLDSLGHPHSSQATSTQVSFLDVDTQNESPWGDL